MTERALACMEVGDLMASSDIAQRFPAVLEAELEDRHLSLSDARVLRMVSSSYEQARLRQVDELRRAAQHRAAGNA